MQQQVNMRDPQYKVQTNTFYFKKIGDFIQGTLIGRRITTNPLKQGAEQLIYDLKVADGAIVSVFGKAGIDFQMKSVKLGQIVGMEYVKDLPSKRAGYSATHVIQIYADPKIVDQEWLNEEEEMETIQDTYNDKVSGGEQPNFMNSPQPEVKTPRSAVEVKPLAASPAVATVATTAPVQAPSKLDEIRELAKATIPGVDDNNFMNKVMETLGVPCTIPNYDKIITMLKG